MPSPIKIAACQIEVIPGRPDLNLMKMLKEIEIAKNNQDDIIIFSEMVISGYLIGDDWENEALLRDLMIKNQKIVDASDGITVVWGNVDADFSLRNEDGRTRKYNAAFVAQNGKMVSVIHKTLMPTYREFDDARHFYSYRKEIEDKGLSIKDTTKPVIISINNQEYKMGVSLCEDMWSDDYSFSPVEYLLDNGADFIVNLSCSPWTWRKNDKRHRVVKERLDKKPVPFIYVNNTGIQNNGKNIFLFDGNTTIYNPNGSLHKVAKDYTEETLRTTLFLGNTSIIEKKALSDEIDTEELYNGIVFGIRKFFNQCGFTRATIGLSGGIDSALSAAFLSEAIGPENVFGINMPSQYNSNTTKGLAKQLADNLSINYTVVPIQQSYEHTCQQVNETVFTRSDGTETTLQLSGLNMENIQARDRGSRVLAGVASALNSVFINNGNKTETALGYATLYGDVNGAIAPLADLYKTEVYQLARYINRHKEIIPEGIINIVPSAELSDKQNVDEGQGDPIIYPYHDKLLRAFIVFRKDPEDILELYKNKQLEEQLKCPCHIIQEKFPTPADFTADLEKTWKMYRINYFKRVQSPPIIAVSKRAFGFDLRESQQPVYFTERYYELKNDLIKNK